MRKNIRDKGNVGLDATDTNLAQGAGRLVADAHEGIVPRGDLHEQGIVIRRNHRADAATATVHADAKAAGVR